MKREKLVEELAKVIFNHEAGVDPEEYLEATGVEKKGWGDNVPCKFSDEAHTLVEHERDDYRYQAQKVVKFLEERKLLK